MNAMTIAAPILTRHVVDHIDLLERLGQDSAADLDSLAALAREFGRDKDNFRKTLKLLTDEGLIEPTPDRAVPILTAAGRDAVAAWARANGPAMVDGPAYPDGGVVLLTFDILEPWPAQPRTHFDDAFIDELSVSIADKGVLQPLTVRPVENGRFQVVIGENRRRASCIAVAKKWQPADLAIPCRVRKLSDAEAFEIAIAENVQRDDLHWMDEAEALYRLLQMGKTAPEISRIFGGARGKRSINDYTAIARDLPTDVKTLAYQPAKLPNGQPNPQCLTYTKAREMVGQKTQKTGLDLSPLLALTLMEIVDAALGDTPIAKAGSRVGAWLYRPPQGGAFQKLQDMKLITCGFNAGQMTAWVPLTEDVQAWLRSTGYEADPHTALRGAQENHLGPLGASRIGPMEYATAELNEPAAANPPPAATGGDMGEVDRPQAETEGVLPDASDEPEPEMSDWERRLIGIPATRTPEPAPAPAAPKPDPAPLAAMLEIVLIEAAHKIAAEGVERGPDTWAAVVLVDAHKDTRVQTLIQTHRFLAFLPKGTEWMVCVTKRGRDWLWENLKPTPVEVTGRALIDDDQLAAHQQRLLGAEPASLYSTPWLNNSAPDTATPAVSGDAPRPPAETEMAPPAVGPDTAAELGAALDDIAHQAAITQRRIDALTAALRQADGLLGQLDGLLGRVRSKLSTVQQAEADQFRRMIENAREAARPHLPEGL